MSKLDLILHPVRLRILVVVGDHQRTVGQIASALPDIAQATLYRHINALVEGNILTVTEEKPIRGTVERTYALADANAASLRADDLARLSKDDHLRYFSIFSASLMASFSQYLDAVDSPDFATDGVGYHLHDLYLSPDEIEEFSGRLRAAIAPYLEPKPNRKRKLFSTIIIPTGDMDQ